MAANRMRGLPDAFMVSTELGARRQLLWRLEMNFMTAILAKMFTTGGAEQQLYGRSGVQMDCRLWVQGAAAFPALSLISLHNLYFTS